jgi:type II secretory pathway pseudopilin PulG
MTSALGNGVRLSNYTGSRFLVRIGIACAIIAILAGVLLAGYRLWLRNQIRVELEKVRNAGLPVALDEVDNWYPTVATEENAASAFCDHFYSVKPGPAEITLPIVGNTPLPKPRERLDAGLKLQIGTFLENNSNRLQVIHQAMRLGKSRYPIDLNLGAATLLPHLSKIREAKNLLQLQVVFTCDSGHRGEAINALVDEFRLAETLKNEPIMISQVTRLTLINEGTESLQRIVSIFSLSTEEIELLSGEIGRVENGLKDCWQRMLVGERSLGIDVFNAPPNKVTEYLDSANSINSANFPALIFATRRLVGIWDADNLFYLRIMARANELPTMKFSAAFSEAGRLVSDASRQTPQHMMSAMLLPNFQTEIAKLVATEAALRACVIGLGIERYHKETGHLPDQLQELVPRFLRALPLDPGNETPFAYVRNGTGYSIESVVMKAEGRNRIREENAPAKKEGRVAFAVERRADRD